MQYAGTAVGRQVGMSPIRFRSVERKFDPLIVTLVFLLFLALACQLLVRLRITDQGYELAQLRSEMIRNDAQLRQLHYDFNLYTRPQTLQERAEKELQMQPLQPVTVRRLETVEVR